VLDRYQPDLLILCHGGNDLLRNNGQQQLLENLESMVNLAQSRGVDVVLVGVPQPKLLFLKPAQVYDRLAEKRKLVYLRDALPGLEGDPAMKSDPIHLNPNGYRRLAEAIHELLIDSGALPSG
jgi:acyl-CoA thioesterase-1